MGLNKLFVLLLLIALTSGSDLSVKSDNFANTVYQHLSEKGKNCVFSPLSLHAVLALAYQGAVGRTADVLSNYFLSPSSTSSEYRNLLTNLNAAQNVRMEIANKIYVENDRQFNTQFEKTATENFQAEVDSVDFRQSKDAANKINDWVKQKTHNKIKKLVSSNDFDEMTRAVLLNAIYFKGEWASKFKKTETKTEKFYLDGTQTVDCPMMHQSGDYYMGDSQELDATLLRLNFRNERFSLIIILPNSKTGIERLEERLPKTDFTALTRSMWGRTAEVYLPRFKIESEYDFKEPFTKVGLADIYSENAEFRNIVKNENLTVSKIIQKATIEINEEGGEASAATAIILIPESADYQPPPPAIFRADHPFMYLITFSLTEGIDPYDFETNSIILFMGKVAKPEIVN